MTRQTRVPTNPNTLITLHLIDAPEDRERQLRREYIAFCEDARSNLAPVEAEFSKFPTFTEWKESKHA